MSTLEIPKEWKKISVKSAEFILNETKDYVDYTLKEAEKITNRTYALLLLLITILSALIGFTYTTILEGNYNGIIYVNFFIIMTIAAFIMYLSSVIRSRGMKVKGRRPEKLMKTTHLINPALKDEENYLAFILREIINCEDKIAYNLSQNKLRRNKLNMTLKAIAVLFPLYIVIAFFAITQVH
ncbi:hypothetical protein EZY14_017360 [Kordia sp. TARA_039_SRF]|jgi:uncharacterized membrane protein|nr:hypothetical protein EZY14_017360 [Kordia sp. TARA_039_SRF]